MKTTLANIGILLLLVIGAAHAQDVQFSQFYAAPVYHNPAFAGTEHCERYIIQQRVQWPRLDAKYTTTHLSFDKYYFQYNSGVGAQLTQDFQGGAVSEDDEQGNQIFFDVSTTELNVNYAYELHFNKTMSFRAGFQLGGVYKYLGNSQTLPSYYTHQGRNAGATATQYNVGTFFVDIASGGLFYTKNLYFGFAGHHLNKPNQAWEIVDGTVDKLARKGTLIGGYRINLEKSGGTMAYLNHKVNKSITPTIHYKFEGKSDQFDFGLYGVYDHAIMGLWYRGIPMKKYQPELHNNESFAVLLGWMYQGYKLGYSYDFTLSKLRPAKTGGAHEIHLSYTPCKRQKRRKPMKRLPCPVPMF